MAIFHMAVKTVSRGKAQSAVAKAAYNARANLKDERTGEMKNYSRTAGLIFSGIFAPKNAPQWANDRAALWNAVEAGEKRKDAQLARDITLGLPHELTDEQRRQLVTDFVREQFQRRGMVADVSIHAPGGNGDNRNYHAHILLTMREIGPEGFGQKVRDWNSKENLEKWREAWERTQNRYLERYGHEARVDRRTLEAQGIDRSPTTHLGPQISAMERRSQQETERGNTQRNVFSASQEAAKLKIELAQLQKQIRQAERESARRLHFKEAGRSATIDTQKMLRQTRRDEFPASRFERGTNIRKDTARKVANENKANPVAKAPSRAFDMLGRTALKVAEGVFSLFVPDPPKTPEQIDKLIKQRDRAAERAEIDWSKYLYNTEHERIVAHQKEQARQQDLEREDWNKQQKGQERER